MKIEISEPLPESELGYRTLHEIRIDGKYVGYVDVGYLRKEDIKTFKGLTKGKLKRHLKPGQPFGVQLFINSVRGMSADELGTEKIKEIVECLKAKLKGLDDRDLFIIELRADGKRIIGRGIDLRS